GDPRGRGRLDARRAPAVRRPQHAPPRRSPTAPRRVAGGAGRRRRALMDRDRLVALAERVLRLEAQAILDLCPRLDERFARAVAMLHGCSGRVIVTGMGKSGLVGRKIAATLASTGTPAYFLHPAEGVHGDLGMIARGDVV